MKNVYKLIMISITALFLSCDNDEILAPENYATFDTSMVGVSLDVGSSVSGEVKVFKGGTSGGTYNLIIDESTTVPMSSIDVPSSVEIPGGANEATVGFTVNYTDEFSVTGGNLVLRLEDNAENILGTSQVTVQVSVTCENPATVNFEFDGYASETTWSITDMDDNVIYSGGGYSDGQASFTREVCLADGNYKFVVNDSFGDGLSFPNIGTASISFNGNVLTEAVGDFGTGFVGEFTIQN
ncbi:hypothetical protein LB452_01040 [Psychroflexus sp. CAK8W]|uniref:DUF1735 domain-containing protein n=1 Tax=Psychroflexus longus TaxID=2873596 RepID=A0ABS7XEX6_9FLAO|nr:hypothetical protein [Psychroflexus longus]MBZ9777494.1 hypothetical protein [Psychroflexus longus]